MSMSGSEASAAGGRIAFSMEWRVAKASAESWVRDPTATTRWVVDACSDATKREAIRPVPSTPQRSDGTESGEGRRGAGRASGSERDVTAYLLGESGTATVGGAGQRSSSMTSMA